MRKYLSIFLLMLALVMTLAACGNDGEITVSVDADGYVIVNGVKTEHKVHVADEVTVNGDGFVVVNGVITNIIADKNDVITVDADGYVIVNGVKTEHKVHTADEVSVNNDGFVVVNGAVTDIVADKDDVITVDADGYVVVNGVKTEHEVKNKNHSFSPWQLYNEDATDCEKRLYHRICSECSVIEWKEGTYEDHNWTTVTTDPTCQAGGFDTKTCSACGKVEICNETSVGEHAYLSDYSYDNGFHWYACQHCSNIKDKTEHTMNAAGICGACQQLVGATEGVIYDISTDRTYAVVIAYTGTATNVRIAEEYQGLPVTQIYKNAFYQKNITMVIIPDSVTAIGDSAFYNCSSLTSVTIGNSVTTIGEAAFYACHSLTSIIIPDSVTTIGRSAFDYCSKLTSVTIPDSVITIERYAFYSCTALQYVEYGNCKYLGNAENPYLALITVVNSNYSTYTIHENTKIIAGLAFSGCSRMIAITIPDSVTAIGDSAFYNCSSLTSVTIGNSVTTIDYCAFYNCSSLTEIYFNGTKEQWQAITKDSEWNSSTGKYTIYCTDGDIKKIT